MKVIVLTFASYQIREGGEGGREGGRERGDVPCPREARHEVGREGGREGGRERGDVPCHREARHGRHEAFPVVGYFVVVGRDLDGEQNPSNGRGKGARHPHST